MLSFKETSEHYIITESILGFNDTKVRVFRYSKDLMHVQIDQGPVQKTVPEARDWFEKFHRKHF